MNKYIYILFLVFLGVCPLVAQESYYYCQGIKVFLPENKLVRYVGLKNTLTEDQVKNIQKNLNVCCAKIYEYTPYFAKYFILEDKIEQFNGVIHCNDSLICLNSSNYALDDTLILYPARTILVKVKPSISLLPVLDSIRVPYINVIPSKYNSQEYQISLSSDVALQFAALLYETGLFEYSQPDFYGFDIVNGYEDNPYYQYQWAVHNDINMNLLSAWNITTGHPQIKIAVLDCGVDYNHPDLTDNLLEGYDAVDDPNHPSQVCCGENESDYDYHGTCCVGIIGASNNEEGLVGISHTSKIIPIRINHTVVSYYKEQDPNNNPTPHIELIGAESWKIDAFNHACYEDKASVISCSFTTNATPAIRSKILEVCQNGREGKGCIVVVSSGNKEHTLPNPLTDLMGPFASQSCVIAVGGD